MKFFYVNNSLCEGCDDCSVVCPVGAVYTAGGKRYIAHDKCTSCGSCIRTCGYNAVSMESIDRMVERMENADLYLSRIRRLEKELAQVNDRLENAVTDLHTVISLAPTALAVCDASGRVGEANGMFRDLAEGAAAPGDAQAEIRLSDILPEGTVRILLGATGTDNAGAVNCTLNGKPYRATGAPLSDGRILCVLDDLSDGSIASARITESLHRAIERKMEMVRRIGTILGDEASSTLNDMNDALRLVEHTAPGATGQSEEKK